MIGNATRSWLAATLVFIVGTGCEQSPAPTDLPPAVVTVSQPVRREITDFEHFTGRTDAVESVDVRARVTGYLENIHFKPAADVTKGDLLFEIDSRTYKAELERAEGEVTRAEARFKRLDADYRRISKLVTTNAASREEFDRVTGDRAEAEASVASAKANVGRYRLDVGFCRITAPISGRISRPLITEGNLVNGGLGGATVLTTIVSMEPMHVYFDVDERTVLRVQKMIRERKEKPALEGEVDVFIGLANEEGFPHRGVLDFVDNRVDPSTGTIRARAMFPNKKKILTPGLFVRVQIPLGNPHEALLVPERALGSDQGQKFVYVVNEKDEVVFRPVETGTLHAGLRVIEKGVAAEDWVITNGLQRVRPGAKVEAKKE